MTKRFYREAVTSPADGAFWQIQLDGKSVKTPTGKPLSVSSQTLADRIRMEWAEQGEEIVPQTMPLTRLVGVALERADSRDDLVADIRAYAATDLLSYRADGPSDFATRQSEVYDPLLDWASDHGMPLRSTIGIVAIEQDPLTLDRLAGHATGYDDIALTLFAHLTATYGSAVLALAVMQGRLEGGEAYDLSILDDTYRAEVWGEDADATARTALIREETVGMCAMIEDLDIPNLEKVGI